MERFPDTGWLRMEPDHFSRNRIGFINKPEKLVPDGASFFQCGGEDSDDAALRLLTFLNFQNHNV
jgi:hypothetical protein